MFVELATPPVGPLEVAPLSNWTPEETGLDGLRTAFWDAEGVYLLCLMDAAGTPRWFAGLGPAGGLPTTTRRGAKVLPFRRPDAAAAAPRFTMRVVRTAAGGPAGAAGTTVLAGRAGRSLRWPA
jgi:hypothetical protein